MLMLLLASLLCASAMADQRATDELDPASCVDAQPECPHWKGYCASNDVVRKRCRVTCASCRPDDGDSALQAQLQESQLQAFTAQPQERICGDSTEFGEEGKCGGWIRPDPGLCQTNKFIREKCKGTCNLCLTIPRQYDTRFLPRELDPIAWLVGRWRSEAGGKARFPTIPNFTYGEQLDFSIADPPRFGARALNYSAFAWGINNRAELHSEFGFVAVQTLHNSSAKVALTTAMNNGFVTVEEGFVGCWGAEGDYRSCPQNPSIVFYLEDIGRISFSRDLPVHGLKRTWKLLPQNRLEQSLEMETLTHPPQEHTRIVYTKIFP